MWFFLTKFIGVHYILWVSQPNMLVAPIKKLPTQLLPAQNITTWKFKLPEHQEFFINIIEGKNGNRTREIGTIGKPYKPLLNLSKTLILEKDEKTEDALIQALADICCFLNDSKYDIRLDVKKENFEMVPWLNMDKKYWTNPIEAMDKLSEITDKIINMREKGLINSLHW